MPSHLDFDSTKTFRNYILGRTLTVPNGPQNFTADSYSVQSTSDMSNVDPGDVETIRPQELVQAQTSNLFKPIEYFVNENLATIPRRANLSLYPYFETGQYHSFISIMTGQDYSNESEMMKFAAWNIQNNEQGPFFGRMQSNLYRTTSGRVRVLDALQGNTSTAINLLTGRETLIEPNTRITVAKTLPGKGIDFLQTVTGVEFPWSEIPGDYLSNPKNPIQNRPEAKTEAGRLGQDITGALGSLVGIQRRPTTTRKPSDLFIEYSGQAQKNTLYDNLSYSKYGPDYTRTARSQNTSKVFNFIDRVGMGVNKLLGLDAPKLPSYIGDDRGNDVKYAMSDFYDRQVKSSYYLSVLFDEVQATVFLRTKGISEGGGIGGKLTWISTKSQNKLGANNVEYQSESSQFTETLSTKYPFREDSILGLTQEILETMPTEGGAARSHVANVIDQTSRIFREDEQIMSRGSNVKYIDKYTGTESGVEYCRVWTKDRSYMNNSDTMKKSGLSRKFNSSVFSNAWNLNIYPNSNGNGGFDSSSTNISKGKGDGFYAKKYMFSIENLAWKSSNTPGFTYNDLPYCERGGNGGRVMWFPPYGLKVTEQNAANWEENVFLGRPEPVYTYQNTSRHGTVQFKVLVDHPSILNLMVKDLFKNMSDEESDNYINAFFAGCEDIDFYGLIRKYTTLTQTDVEKIQAYLNEGKDSNTVKQYETVIRPQPNDPTPKNDPKTIKINTALYFRNDYPNPNSREIKTDKDYGSLYTDYESYQNDYLTLLNTGLDSVDANGPNGWTSGQKTDYKALTANPNQETRPTTQQFTDMKATAVSEINTYFGELTERYNDFESKLETLKIDLSGSTVQDIRVIAGSRTSSVADDNYNLYLAYRRSFSVIKYIVNQLADTQANADSVMAKLELNWKEPPAGAVENTLKDIPPIPITELGYESAGNFVIEYVANVGEQPVGTPGSGIKSVDCTDNYTIVDTALKHTAPVTFLCRETSVSITYEKKEKDAPPPKPLEPITTLVKIPGPTTTLPSPPLDEMKRIIMKTLSECYYFKVLEEDSPVQFSSLKEKLRYFHPSFHSMTPEGLNTRLTFLQQCIRPGETLPIKGISDVSDTNARNTTFGPPPICVMRIGDFYHSKVAIRDVNLEFEEDLWDLNPEGIGVQPMIANVTLQLSFIGGHGLAKPVERLQNALSSNFYANSEIYDPRSISTETEIDGQSVEKFTKEFLDTLVEDHTQRANETSQDLPSTEKQTTVGEWIGDTGNYDIIPTDLNYKPLVTQLFDNVEKYFTQFGDSYNQLLEIYDTKLLSMLISPTYRTIKDYTVQTNTGTAIIELLGEYPKGDDLSVLTSTFKSQMLDKIDNENISVIFGFDKDLTPAVLRKSEQYLKPYVKTTVGYMIDEMVQKQQVKDIKTNRDKLIVDLDRLNFVIEMGHDSKIVDENKKEYVYTDLSGYTADELYSPYEDVVPFITEYHEEFFEDLDESYVFSTNTTMSTNDLSYFLSVLLKNNVQNILNLYEQDNIVFTDTIKGDIEKRLNKFMLDDPKEKKFTFTKHIPESKDDNPISFGIIFEFELTDQAEIDKLISVNTTSGVVTTSELNYYRNG